MASHQAAYYCFLSTHSLVASVMSVLHRNNLKEAKACLPDGMPIVKALKWLYGQDYQRLPGIDTFSPLLTLAVEKGYRVLFYGHSEQVLARIENRLKREYPTLNDYLLISPPFASAEELVQANAFQQLVAFQPNLVFVGLGCPKQDTWMRLAAKHMPAAYFGVGYAFDVFSGSARRAPVWMQTVCLEWFFRLMQDPLRLFWRYAINNMAFMVFVALEATLGRLGLNWMSALGLPRQS